MVTGKGLELRWVFSGMVWNVWAFDFVHEKFHNTSPCDFESVFIKIGDSETKEGSKIEEARS